MNESIVFDIQQTSSLIADVHSNRLHLLMNGNNLFYIVPSNRTFDIVAKVKISVYKYILCILSKFEEKRNFNVENYVAGGK